MSEALAAVTFLLCRACISGPFAWPSVGVSSPLCHVEGPAAAARRRSGAQRLCAPHWRFRSCFLKCLRLPCNDVKCDMAPKCQACQITCEPRLMMALDTSGGRLALLRGVCVSVQRLCCACRRCLALSQTLGGARETGTHPIPHLGLLTSHMGPGSSICVDEEK